MGAGSARVEVLSESEHARVVRLYLPEGGSVIRKEPLGPGREERVVHEVEILRRLSGVEHVVQLAPKQPDTGSILLQDVGGVPMEDVPTPLDSPWLVSVMLDLAQAVAGMHQRGVLHCDINPGNLLLGGDGRSVYLIDFTLAATFTELRPEFTHPKEIVGTLPYLAPEQTGRTGRVVDGRADLYGLGATMYELATGHPPFGTGDPLRLIHDHLARAPVPPATVNPAIPPAVSEIVMHLLEKEPDSRYQTPEGLIRDLQRVRDGQERLRAGADDFPPRLSEPSRLVGREREIETLRAAFEEALSGQSRAVAVSGGSGVGKSSLIEELRPIATAGDGWFTYGKFDRHRGDPEHDGVRQAFRGLGRFLLAEPEEELAGIRTRLIQALGPNVGLAAAATPEFAALLRVAPEPGDPLTAQVRLQRVGLEILLAVASRQRPVVFVADDVQWAGANPLGFIDQLLSGEEPIEGLLTVIAYREGEVGQSLATLLARWRHQPRRVEQLRVNNLDQESLTGMIAEMLHSAREPAAELAGCVFGLTEGNPYDTVQLLNGLHREGLLRPTPTGWWWDPTTLRQRMARENVTDLTRARVDAMPAATRETLEAMACLGGEVGLHALAVAVDLPVSLVQERLGPALDDGLLVMAAGRPAARFRHDRLRDTVQSGIPDERLRTLRLRLARRLATQPDLFAVAAEQYMPVIDAVTDSAERDRVVHLLHQAAEQGMWIGESAQAERMLTAAVRLTDDTGLLLELYTDRHTALYRLGRLAEADEIYEKVVRLSRGPYDRVEVTRVQITSLTSRGRPVDAVTMGLDLLGQLGWTVPTSPEQLDLDIDRGLDWFYEWVNRTSEADDLRRPEITDPTVLATGALISRIVPACFFRDQTTMAWLALTAAHIWAERGPTPTLLGALGYLPWVLIGRRQDYRTGHRLLRRLLAVGEQRDYEPNLSEARFLYSSVCHWFDPIEEVAAQGHRAREGLIRGGELQTACYAYLPKMSNLQAAPSMEEYTEEVDSALAFVKRTGNEHAAGIFRAYRWLAGALRGEPPAAEEDESPALAADPIVASSIEVTRALVAATFDDPAALSAHSRAAMNLLPVIEATYGEWAAHLLHALALAEQVRTAPEHTAELAELDRMIDWIRQRAADMPMNFRHLASLVEAERAWALRDFSTAIHAFNAALRHAGQPPWPRAYIAERAAKFMLDQGLDRIGWSLLVEARESYRLWGAQAKVDQLDRAYPSLDIATDRSAGEATRRSSITAGAIDMLAILAASRALSSETSITALRTKLVEVLSAMTGATDISLLVWNADQNRWLAATDDGNGPSTDRHRMPQTVVRYVERTREPLIIPDATSDDRFARDPYFADLSLCSVLAAPVLSRGTLRAILLLENHLIRDAFSAERLEGVMLIAGQLGVSLDNALLYTSLEQKVDERTQQLAHANQRLAELSITDPLTGLANRRRLADSLREEWARAQRTHAPLSLAMVDIDHFKRYNDLYGHPAGDRCLQRVATQLAHAVRDTDLVARYGGEEFAVIMPNTDLARAREAAERLRTAITDLNEPLTPDEIVTASIGVATLHDPDQTTDQLIQNADAALYEAKRDGRNRVAAAEF